MATASSEREVMPIAVLAGGAQLLAGTLTADGGAEGVEGVPGGAQRSAASIGAATARPTFNMGDSLMAATGTSSAWRARAACWLPLWAGEVEQGPAEELARRFAGNPNLRVVYPETGFDSGEFGQ